MYRGVHLLFLSQMRVDICVYMLGPTLVLSNNAKGFSPPLQISHSVVPKLHLSAVRLRLAGSVTHSGGTQGILSTRTVNKKKPKHTTGHHGWFDREMEKCSEGETSTHSLWAGQ